MALKRHCTTQTSRAGAQRTRRAPFLLSSLDLVQTTPSPSYLGGELVAAPQLLCGAEIFRKTNGIFSWEAEI